MDISGNFIAFFAAIPHIDISGCLTTLQSYDIGRYIIAKETAESHDDTNGEHLHFLVEMDAQNYKNFSEALFRKKYKLRGKATKDHPRQYGRCKDIRELPKMIAYTIKDKNYITNFDVSSFECLSYSKTENKVALESKKQKVKVKSWSQQLTESIQKKYPDMEWKFNAQSFHLIHTEVLLALGIMSKKLSPMITRDLTYGQFNALAPNDKEFNVDIFTKAFPEFGFEISKYYL